MLNEIMTASRMVKDLEQMEVEHAHSVKKLEERLEREKLLLYQTQQAYKIWSNYVKSLKK